MELSHVRVLCMLLSCAFAAGVVGGVANFLIAPVAGLTHITTAFGCDIDPGFHKADLYQKAFWGGLWGLVFLLPLQRAVGNIWITATTFGLLPSLIQIFVVFPLATPFGIGGVGLGASTPIFVLLFNIIGWSIPGYLWFVLLTDNQDDDYSYSNPLLA